MLVVAMHSDCVACQASAENLTGEQATLTALATLRTQHSVEEVIRDLCFRHRRIVEDADRVLRERGCEP
jgi:hypothetical protein